LPFYNARYYDPGVGRFISADTVVPGNASGGMDGVALKTLTVSFDEYGFVSKLNSENQLGPWFMLSDKEKQQLGSTMGPSNPQALNRYSYVQNNPLRYTDPSGHCIPCLPTIECMLSAACREKTWNQFLGFLADAYFQAGGIVSFKGTDGVDRQIQSRVKENIALRKEAGKLGKEASQEANSLLKQFLNGNTSPGLGRNGHLEGTNIFYLRGKDGARVFMRQVGKDSYEILAYADKNNENAVIKLLLQHYGP
jgi:hypothetical protein